MEALCTRRKEVEDDDKNAANAWNDYWSKINELRKPKGEMKYDNLITFVYVMASSSCSNAPVERFFSSLKLRKIEKRYPMKSETLMALISSQSAGKILDDKKLPPHPSCRHESHCNQ